MMPEAYIQKKRIEELEREGYYVIKLIKTNKNGMPDILAIPRGADVLFCEVKTEIGRVSAIQDYRLREARKWGFRAEVFRGWDRFSKKKLIEKIELQEMESKNEEKF